MIGHVTLQAEPAEPPVGEVQVDLVAQPPLRSDAEAVAHDQHSDHQLGIDRGPARLAVEGPQLHAQAGQVYEPIDRSQQVIGRHVPFKTEAVEQRLLWRLPLTHHQPASPHQGMLNQDLTRSSRPSFSTPSAETGNSALGRVERQSGRGPRHELNKDTIATPDLDLLRKL